MRCDGYKLLLGRFWLDTEGKFISQGEQSAIWNDLLREVVDSPTVDTFVQKSDSRQCSWIPLLESIQQFRATKSDENWFHTTHTCNSTWIRSFLCDGVSYTSKGWSNWLKYWPASLFPVTPLMDVTNSFRYCTASLWHLSSCSVLKVETKIAASFLFSQFIKKLNQFKKWLKNLKSECENGKVFTPNRKHTQIELAEVTKSWSYLWCTITVCILSYIIGLTGADEDKTM